MTAQNFLSINIGSQFFGPLVTRIDHRRLDYSRNTSALSRVRFAKAMSRRNDSSVDANCLRSRYSPARGRAEVEPGIRISTSLNLHAGESCRHKKPRK